MKPAIAMPGPRFGRARRYLTTHRLTRVRLPDPAHRAFFAARRARTRAQRHDSTPAGRADSFDHFLVRRPGCLAGRRLRCRLTFGGAGRSVVRA
ncbi:hypothetical protein BOC52_06125 [Burkholderia pseudomallei]|nr:hypothetical protein BOC52_06125 [Burkholderia pseudomallei]ARL93456.1 hypothetical protein BOC58_11085 [Burkholderia pseudomallei]